VGLKWSTYVMSKKLFSEFQNRTIYLTVRRSNSIKVMTPMLVIPPIAAVFRTGIP